MTTKKVTEHRIIGRLGSADGAGTVRIEERYDTDIDDLWTALTVPERLSRWYGQVSGELRVGGAFRLYIETSQLEASGRVEVCEPPRHLRVRTGETEESWRKGDATEGFQQTTEASLTPEGEQTLLVLEIRGLPPDKVAVYGAGWQIHAENLGAYLSGHEPGEAESRWGELVPAYQEQAAVLR